MEDPLSSSACAFEEVAAVVAGHFDEVVRLDVAGLLSADPEPGEQLGGVHGAPQLDPALGWTGYGCLGGHGQRDPELTGAGMSCFSCSESGSLRQRMALS